VKATTPTIRLLGQRPRTQCIRRWVGPKASLDVFEKSEMSCSFRNCKPSHNVISYSEGTEENLWDFEGSAIPHIYCWVMKAKWLD
jgi:hypothetical protein